MQRNNDYATRNKMVVRALERIKDICGSNKKYKDLLGVCEYTASRIKAANASGADQAMSLTFVPLYMALARHPKTSVIALEVLRKLMEHSYITGDMRWDVPRYDDVSAKDAKWKESVQVPGPLKRTRAQAAPGEERLIDHVVTAICEVYATWANQDVVQLYVIQALLASVSTASCGVHGSTLIRAVRITYNICLATCNSVNGVVKETNRAAVGALKHIILLIYQRMETANAAHAKRAQQQLQQKQQADHAPQDVAEAQGDDAAAARRHQDPGEDGGESGGADDAAGESDADADAAADEEVLGEATPAGVDDEAGEEATAGDEELATPQHATAAGGGGGGDMPTPSLSAQNDPAATPAQRRASDMKNGDATLAPEVTYRNYQERDAYTLLEKLCQRCENTCVESATTEQRTSKLLSLQLIKYILEHFGGVLRGSPIFTTLVKKNLCLSLLQNCVSPVLPIFKECCRVFIKLIEHFWDDLKREIELFFTNVFFIILESPNASDQQKMVVVGVISTLANMPEKIVNIFLNYDCDVQSVNVFETMTDNLSKVVSDRRAVTHGGEISKQDQDMRLAALQALVMILRSITQWMGKFEETPTDAGSLPPTSPMRGSEMGTPARDLDQRAPPAAEDGDGDDVTDNGVEDADTAVTPAAGPEGEPHDGDDIEEMRKKKKELADLIDVFNKAPKKGLEACWDMGILPRDDPLAVANWMKETPRLSKDAIGTYLGILKEFNRKVLSEFIDGFDFAGLEIDEAVRKLMSTFRIHGEAEAIDVTMEKFSETYTRANPETFPNATTAFVLAFSIIMLHTDAHSSQIKKVDKMTKAEFCRNNRGIDDGKDLPQGLLHAIYDRVTSTPFTLEGEKSRAASATTTKQTGLFDLTSAKKKSKLRQTQYSEDAKAIVMRTKALLCGEAGTGAIFRFASKLRHVRPMFEAAWARMLPAFSVLLEESDQTEIIDLCVEGFSKCIRISCAFYLDTERDAFVTALSKLTFLNNHREIEEKNVKSIKALIDIAQTESGALRSSWYEVLGCFSQLDMLQLLGAGAKPDYALANASPTGQSARLSSNSSGMGNQSQRECFRQYEERNSLVIAEHIDEVAVSRIYSNTANLSDEAIVDFVRHLCRVSTNEIELTTPPRRFSLQKLIETLDLNRGRIPSHAWSQVWRITAEHLVRVGTNRSASVSMIGIDSLRQLSAKFLEKPDPPGYMFQRMFLDPFEKIFQRSNSSANRELIVRCITQIVNGRGVAGQVTSGWKSIFAVLTAAASDKSEHVVTLAFDTLKNVIEVPIPLPPGDAYADMVHGLIAFSTQVLDGGVAIEAIQHLIACSKILATIDVRVQGDAGGTAGGGNSFGSADSAGAEDSEKMLPIFTGLGSCARQHPLRDCRLAAVNGLFAILKAHAQAVGFSLRLWKIILSGSVFPIFEDALCTICTEPPIQPVQKPTPPQPADGPPGTPQNVTAVADAPSPAAAAEVASIVRGNIDVVELGLTLLVDLVFEFFTTLKPLLGDVLNVILSCIKRPTPKRVAHFGVTLLVELVVNHSPATWDDLVLGYHLSAGENVQRRIERDELPEESMFTDVEWQVLTQKVSRVFTAKLSAAGFVDARAVAEQGAGDARQVQAAVAQLHLTTLLNFVLTVERMVNRLAPYMTRDTLTEMLDCFASIHSSDYAASLQGDGAKEAAQLARDCQERAMFLHVRSLLSLHPPYEGRDRSPYIDASPHAETVAALLYPQLMSFFRKPRGASQQLLVYIIDALTALRDGEFTAQLDAFYPFLLDLIMSTSTQVREAVRRCFAKIGRVRLNLTPAED